MKFNQDFSDEILNAFLDDELEYAERTQILSALCTDERLTQRICDLQKVQGLIQLAYSEESLAINTRTKPDKSNVVPQHRFVAGVLILLGVFIGWFAHQNYHSEFRTLKLTENTQNFPAHNKDEIWHVLLHISSNDSQRFDVLLSETEYLLESYKQNNLPIEIELLANGKGVNLLEDTSSEQTKKLVQLTGKYNNLTLSVCGKTLERLQKESDTKLVLLPNTMIVRSAIYQVTKRQKEGWSYIRI